MTFSTTGSWANLAGTIIGTLVLIYVGYRIWKSNKKPESLKSIDQTLGGMLGENDSKMPTDSESDIRPWTCIHCGTANSSTENFCTQCGKESRS